MRRMPLSKRRRTRACGPIQSRSNTIEVYEYVLKGLREHTPPSVNVRDVLPDHVRSYVHVPKEVAGEDEEVSNATKRHRHSHLATFFRWAIE